MINIIKILSNKDNYNKYISYIKDYTLSKESCQVVNDMGEYYSQFPNISDIDWDTFGEWFRLVKHPIFKPEKHSLYESLFSQLKAAEAVESSLEKELLESLIEKDYATQIADKALRIAGGEERGSLSDVQGMVEDFHRQTGKVAETDSLVVTDSLHDILNRVNTTGLDWRLDFLNKSVGPLRKGDFIIVGARPDTGKTTFLAAETTFMAPQLEENQSVVWFNNEEQGWKVKYRVIQSALGWETSDIQSNPLKAAQEYDKIVGEKKIIIVDKADMNVRDVELLLKKYEAGLIIFDQLWKVHGFEKRSTNEVANQVLLANWARELAKEHAPVINVHQADGSAEGCKYIDMSQLYGSKTGIQGEADAIITIGRSHEPGLEYSRFFYVPKNKMMGGPNTDNAEKNGRAEVLIVPHKARFKES